MTSVKFRQDRHGQALVEFALVLPIMLGLLLGGAEVVRFGADVWAADRAAGTLADWAATHAGDITSSTWSTVAAEELARADCEGQADAQLPDGGTAPGDRVVVDLHCDYTGAFLSGTHWGYGAAADAVVH